MTLYKTLNGPVGSYGHGDYSGYLPHGKRPGKWLPPVKPSICKSGYHYCRDLGEVLKHSGKDLWVVEVRGVNVDGDHKAAAEQMRLLRRVDGWNGRNLRHFACDCAESVLHLAQEDQRGLLQACLDVTRAYADWPDVWAAARDAAWDAAWDAVWAAARDAARAAAWDAQVANLATYLDGSNEWCEREMKV